MRTVMIPIRIKDRKLTADEARAVKRVLEGLGVTRVKRAMTHTCKVGYQNKGWDNCFLTQAFGGKDKLEALQNKHGVYGEIDAISLETGIAEEDLGTLITLFDTNSIEIDREGSYEISAELSLLSYTSDWLLKNGVDLEALYTKREAAGVAELCKV